MAQSTNNRILLSLPPETRAAVMGACERVDLRRETILEEIGAPTSAAWFPETAVISSLATYRDGSTIEMATVGCEACTGVNLVLGQPMQLVTTEVQISGEALRCPASSFRRLRTQHPDFEASLFAAVQAVFYQVMVSGACNGAHSARQRLARWLLTMHDRNDDPSMRMTHEFLAHMLGVRRATVTEAASALQDEGLISYSHGRMAIVDHRGLRKASCECYDLVRSTYEKVLPERHDPR